MMANTRNSQFPEERWEEMRPWLFQQYLDSNMTAEATARSIQVHFGVTMTARQLKNRMTHKWGKRKKIECALYHAMKRVMDARGNHLRFTVPLAHKDQILDYSKIIKQVNRKAKNGTSGTDVSAAWKSLRKSVDYLRVGQVRISGLESDIYTDYPSDTAGLDVSEDAEEGHDDEFSEGEELSDVGEHSDSPQQPVALMTVRDPSRDYSHYLETLRGISAWYNWLAGQLAANPRRRSSPNCAQDLEHVALLTDVCFSQPQLDSADNVSKLLAQMAIELDINDPSRASYERFFDCNLGKTQKLCSWDRHTDKLIVEFTNYYVQQCLSSYSDLDAFDHPDRITSRQILSKLFQVRTGELLQVLWWVMTLLCSHFKGHQLDGLFEDIVTCIGSSRDDYTRALRPIFDVARRANAYYIEDNYTQYQRLSPDASLESEFRSNIDYLRNTGMDRTGDFAIMHMFLAWHLAMTGRPDESLQTIVSAGCLPLAERVLGSHHLAVQNCKAIAAKCYHRLGNQMALHYMNEVLWAMEGCTKPLRPFHYLLKRQQATIILDLGNRTEGFKILKEVINFRLHTFGVKTNPVWSVADQMKNVASGNEEVRQAQQVEQELQASFARSSVSR